MAEETKKLSEKEKKEKQKKAKLKEAISREKERYYAFYSDVKTSARDNGEW